MTPDGIALRHSTVIDDVWSTLIDVYADVKALYEAWGYEPISAEQPSVDGPVLTAMLRRTHPGAGDAEQH